MAVTPGPVFALLGRRQFAEFAVRATRFGDPLAVVAHLVGIPNVVIAVVRVVDADSGVAGTARRPAPAQKKRQLILPERMKDLATRMVISFELEAERADAASCELMRCGRGLQTSQRSDKLSLNLNTRCCVKLRRA